VQNTRAPKPFIVNTYIYEVVEENSHNKHFEEHHNEHDYNTPYKELLTKCQMLTFEQTFI